MNVQMSLQASHLAAIDWQYGMSTEADILDVTSRSNVSVRSYQREQIIEWALRFFENLPPQVRLSNPVVLYDALDGFFPFFLEHITCTEVELLWKSK